MSKAPIVKLWAFSLLPSTALPSTSPATTTSPNESTTPFQTLLTSILALIRPSTPHLPYKDSHAFYRSTTDARDFLMVSAYPSLEENLAADEKYAASGMMKGMFEFVEHRGLWMVKGREEVMGVLGDFAGEVEVEVGAAGTGDGIRGVEVRGNQEVVGEVWVKVTRVEEQGGNGDGEVGSARPTQVGGEGDGLKRWRLKKFI